MASKNKIAVVIIAAIVSVGGISVYLSMDDSSDNHQAIYHTDENCLVSLCYDSGDGEVHETNVTGRNIKDILIDGMRDLGSELTFYNDGSIKTIDGKTADDGKVWAIWKWDTEWYIIGSIYDSKEKISLKENAAFGISMANRFTTNPQGYTNPGFYVNVNTPGSGDVQKVFSTTPKTIFIEAMENIGHDVQESDGNITVDGETITDTNGYALLHQHTEFKVIKNEETGWYERTLIQDDKWERVTLTDERFYIRDRANFAIVPIVENSYDEPEYMEIEVAYKPEGDIFIFLQVEESFVDLIDFDNDAPGLTREELVNGIWVKTVSSTVDNALEKIFSEMEWDYIASEAIVGGNDLRGWIFYFFGLYSNGIYHPEDATWDYPVQYNWNFAKEEWEYNQWTSGYYSYVSNPYFAVIYGNAAKDCNWIGDPDLAPEDAEHLRATV